MLNPNIIKKITVLTGSGISQESGIPTFRDKDGYWTNYDPMSLATKKAFDANPKTVWEWYFDRFNLIKNSIPNKAHRMLTYLEKNRDVVILTQNVDGLHQKAGSKKVIELHGNIFKTKCIVCEFRGILVKPVFDVQKCPNCGKMLRPDIVWFDEELDPTIWDNAVENVISSDLLVVIGTSLTTEPTNELPIIAKNNKIFQIEINPNCSKHSDIMDHHIRKKASDGVNELLKLIKTTPE